MVFCFIGIGKGLRTVFMALVIPSHVPLDRLPGATGLHLLFAGTFYMVSGPVVGLIKDTFNYTVTMHYLNIFTYLIPISLAAVTITLFIGLYALFRGGDFGRSYSNKLMRLRVVLQAIAVAILVLAVWWRSKFGG